MIDFKMVPADTLVDVMSLQFGILTLHFKHQVEGGRYFCANYTSATSAVSVCSEWANSYSRIRISAKNPWLPWFGGDCPVPPSYMVDVKYWKSGPSITGHGDAGDFDWNLISHYRLRESAWQTISEVCDE